MNITQGLLRGAAAALNVSIGFVPDLVIISNLTDGTIFQFAWPNRDIFAFTSGGTNVPKVGDKLKGATSGATWNIADIIVDTGTWAGGDAAGWIVVDQASRVGTITASEVWINQTQQATAGVDDGTITAADLSFTEKIDTAAANVTTTSAVKAYLGDSSHTPGFTVGSVILTANKIFAYTAIQVGGGDSGVRCPNSAAG